MTAMRPPPVRLERSTRQSASARPGFSLFLASGLQRAMLAGLLTICIWGLVTGVLNL